MNLIVHKMDESHFCYIVKDGDLIIGRAYLSIVGSKAKLADIKIEEIPYSPFRIFPLFKLKKSFRGKGYGTALLQRVISHSKELGLDEISGEICGDVSKLIPWYRRMGFSVNSDKSILMKLS